MEKLLFAVTATFLAILPVFPIKVYPETQVKAGEQVIVPLSKMAVAEIDIFLNQIKDRSFLERLELVSARAKGTTYFNGPLGEGLDSPFDTHPLIDLGRVDCVTFCEQTLALALGTNYRDSFKQLQKIRYKFGKIKIEKRNHYFMADWVPNNSWLLSDITKETGAEYAKPLTRVISHKNLFAASPYKNIIAEEADRKITVNYIPKDKLHLIGDKLKTGDIAVFIQDLPGVFASHTGFIIRDKAGKLFFRNATSIGLKQVVDLPYNDLTEFLKKSKKNLGLAIIRPNTRA